MGKRRSKAGTCHICLREGDLTFEHVPPESAFNTCRVMIVEGLKALHLPLGEISGGTYQQRGAGGHTLCARCNNDTGSWYGPAFAEWCAAGMQILVQTRGEPRCLYGKNIYPLRILKQIIAMFCSVRGPDLVRAFPELEKLLRDKTRHGLPDGLRVFVHYTAEQVTRRIGVAMQVNLESGASLPMTELTHPPFGYLMTYDSEPPPDRRLHEITHFAFARYDDQRTMTMNLPLLSTISPLPGDYRTRTELEECAEEGRRWMNR